MRIERLLVAAPLALIAALVQSAAWVPTYQEQATGNPRRLTQLVEASIGDAKILNPLLNADVSSSRITGLVFDGLLDLDEDLRLRGRLARSWRIHERAYLAVDPGATLADGTPAGGAALVALLEAERDRPGGILAGLAGAIEALPATEREVSETRLDGDGRLRTLRVRVRLPPRVRIALRRVDPGLLERLRPLLGPRYGAALAGPGRFTVLEGGPLGAAERRRLLPVIEHNPVIDFELRRGVRFHDGEPFDAEDVRFTYQAVIDPRNLSPRASDFEPIRSLEVLDRYRVRVTYKRLFSPAINAWTIGILPEHLLNRAALEREMDERGLGAAARERFGLRDSRFNRQPIGTGAFRFVAWQSDELIHLRRNPDYWDGPPRYRDYYFRVIPDPLTQEVEFRTGALDSYAPQPHQVERYRADPRYQAFSTLSSGYTYIGYNARRPPLDDPRVRRALGMAIDVDSLIAHLLYRQGERITGPYPRNTEWYDPAVAPLPYDPAGAQRILEQLGWRRNGAGWLEKGGRIFELNLITNNGNPLRKAILTIAQDAWRRIGVKANTQLFEWAVFLEDFINPARFDAVILGWSMGADPDLFQLWHSSQTGRNRLNFVGYRSAEADRLIERIRIEYDRDRQRELARRLHRRIAADQPYTFLYAPRSTRVLDRKIVMVAPGGGYVPVRAARSGDLFYFMNRWIKLARAPRFAPR